MTLRNLTAALREADRILWLVLVCAVIAVLILADRIREALTTDWPHLRGDDSEAW